MLTRAGDKMKGDHELLTAWLKYLKSQKRFKRNVCKRNIYEDAAYEFLFWLRQREKL